MVDTYADSGTMRTAYIQKRHEPDTYLLHLGGILGIGVVYPTERPRRIDIIARIDAYLLDNPCRHISYAGIEVDVGYEGYGNALGMECGTNLAEVLSLTDPLGSKTYVLSSGLNDSTYLSYRGSRIIGGCGGHRLYSDGVFATEWRVAYMDD